jgi:O-antigen/teichoic acid export membrane protein
MLKKLKEGHWPLFLMSSFSSFANLLTPIILVRILTPENMGLYKIFFLYLSILPFLFLTGGPANSVYYWVGKPKGERERYIQSCWNLTTLLSLLILVVGLPLSGVLADYTHISHENVYLMLFAAFLWVPATHFSECSVAHGKTMVGALFGTAFSILRVSLIISAAYFSDNIQNIFIVHTSAFLLMFTVSVLLSLKNKYISFKLDIPKMKEVFYYALPISVTGLLGFFVDKVDMIILSSYLPIEEFAFYSMGCLIIPPLYILDSSVQKVLIPKLSSLYNKNESESAVQFFRKAISDLSFLIIPAIFGLFVYSDAIVKLLYTEQYASSALFLKIFAFSYLLNILPHDAVLRATGHSASILKIYLFTTPISIGVVFLSTKYIGAPGALAAAICIKFLPKIYGITYSKRIMNWKFRDMFPYKRIFIYTSTSLILSALSYVAKPYFSDSLYWLYVCAPIFAIIYLGSLYIPFKRASNV